MELAERELGDKGSGSLTYHVSMCDCAAHTDRHQFFLRNVYNMALSVKGLMKDKTVLYIVLFFAITNVIGFLMLHNVEAVLFFVVIGMLTSYFTKNMIIIMLTSLIATNALVGAKKAGRVQEGLEGMKKKTDDDDSTKAKKKKKEAMESGRPASSDKPPAAATATEDQEETGEKPKLDHAATLSAAYDNLDKLLGSDALQKMSKDSQGLAHQQEKLLGSLDKLEPMIQRAGSMLEGLSGGADRISGMMDKLGSIAGGIGGGGQ